MIITDKKIVVTLEMMNENNMTRHNQLGIPKKYNGQYYLKWVNMFEITEEEFDLIEEYFLQKK